MFVLDHTLFLTLIQKLNLTALILRISPKNLDNYTRGPTDHHHINGGVYFSLFLVVGVL